MNRILTDEDELQAFDKAILAELREDYLNLPLAERLQVKQAFNDVNRLNDIEDRLNAECWMLLEMVDEHMKSVRFGNCEYVLGQASDSANGASCTKTGIYRDQYEMVLCNRCYARMQ